MLRAPPIARGVATLASRPSARLRSAHRTRRIAALVSAGVVAVTGFVLVGPTAAANDTITGASVVGTPFSPNGDGVADWTTFQVTLRREARITLTVRD